MSKSLIDIKIGKKIDKNRLPHIKPNYSKIDVPVGIDILTKFFKKKELRPKYITFEELIRKGLIIVQKPIRYSQREAPMYKGQIYFYDLRYKEEELRSSEIVLDEIPRPTGGEVRIRFEILWGAKGRVRIEGRGCNYINKNCQGGWYEIR